MHVPSNIGILTEVDKLYRQESRRVFATLVRSLGDFDLAEEALHDAFSAAVERWPHEGVPANPRAWLVATGRFKAIDAMRRKSHFKRLQPELIARFEEIAGANAANAALDIVSSMEFSARAISSTTTLPIRRAVSCCGVPGSPPKQEKHSSGPCNSPGRNRNGGF